MPESKNTKQDDYFDDCPVCQYQREIERTGKPMVLSELREAFEKAKEKGGVVGGALFEKNDENAE
ncbi:MAG: hypothetical protein ACD_76C00130G0005 [uncultured bacterium]|nr:MAG: hypothetical protein ACD_76C00130G0005 [uncultured bacterium]